MEVSTTADIDPFASELSLSPACRILVISLDPHRAQSLAESIISGNYEPGSGNRLSAPDSKDPLDAGQGIIIPWEISNKYYTAPVHFFAQPLARLPAVPLWPPELESEKVPAIIFAFHRREPYRELFVSLKEAFEAHGAEVTLAIEIPPPPSLEGAAKPSEDDILEDESEAFFSEHNFEYVDIAETKSDDDSIEDKFNLTGIPRIVSSLHTIMWPSLVRQSKSGPKPSSAVLLAQLDEDDQRERILALFAAADGGVKEDDVNAFEAWLDSDDNQDPWGTGSNPAISSSGQTTAAGFEDDFADFVSAPDPSERTSVFSSEEAFGFEPLGDDDAFPSGTGSPSMTQPILTALASAPDENDNDDADTLEKFDLSQILSHLEAMKTQIAGIDDMDQRRRLAAKVTLGLFGGIDGLDEAEL
ncbi:hypothetical protein BOTBODRAFT_32072 [Botryobasidium botryosum FD-172 SS1]|uniref:Uncharacterized protein n=1 Tax=Botryobasidium botryosum (strain FD-172 SS1) TaxID=930990 RepID=A0A067MHS0_BOTB1|nr:hypothetical protein BOTBODRAFT_32072 [Botryobasidium botryosum FD-172 SS1]